MTATAKLSEFIRIFSRVVSFLGRRGCCTTELFRTIDINKKLVVKFQWELDSNFKILERVASPSKILKKEPGYEISCIHIHTHTCICVYMHMYIYMTLVIADLDRRPIA